MNAQQRISVTQGDVYNDYALFDDVSVVFGNHKLVINSQQQQPLCRFLVDSGIVKYQVYQNGEWGAPVSISGTSVSALDAQTLPANASANQVRISSEGFKVFLDDVLAARLHQRTLYLRADALALDNANPLVLSADLSKTLVLRNTNASDVITVSDADLRLNGLRLTGLAQATQPTDAIPLSQLRAFQPNSMRASPTDGAVRVFDAAGAQTLAVESQQVSSSLPIKYAREVQLDANTLVTKQYADSKLSAAELGVSACPLVQGVAPLSNMDPRVAHLAGASLTAGNAAVTSDHVREGALNKYATDTSLSAFLQTKLGQPNGIVPLDANSQIPSRYINPVRSYQVYSGESGEKTNPAHYQEPPTPGSVYITTEGFAFILVDPDFTAATAWTLRQDFIVASVNGNTGVVLLSTDEVPEGTRKYFDSGMAVYKESRANRAGELLQLDAGARVGRESLNPEFSIGSGSYILRNSGDSYSLSTQDDLPVYTTDRLGTKYFMPLTYDPLVDHTADNALVPKHYVDERIQTLVPERIVSANATNSVACESQGVVIRVAQSPVATVTGAGVNAKVPIVYDPAVQYVSQEQLVTKSYVDRVLQQVINERSGSQEFAQGVSPTLSILANLPVSVPSFQVDTLSSNNTRIVYNQSGYFQLSAGTYRFYLGFTARNVAASSTNVVTIALKDRVSGAQYFYFDLTSATPPQQQDTRIYPYIRKFDAPVQVVVQLKSAFNTSGLAYILVEELLRQTIPTALDSIQDFAHTNVLSVNGVYAQFAAQGEPVLRMDAGGLRMFAPATYDADTPPATNNTLVTKKYVDDSIRTSTQSITDFGQFALITLSQDQPVSRIYVGANILFNRYLLNNSRVLTLDAIGTITLTQGFVYNIRYRLSCKANSNSAALIVALRNVATLQDVAGSRVYVSIGPQQNDTSVYQADVYLDLRTAISQQSYRLTIIVATNIQTIYMDYSQLSVQQIQQITALRFDRLYDESQQNGLLATPADVQVLVGSQPRARFATNSIDVSAPVAYTDGVLPSQPQHLVTKAYVDQFSDQLQSLQFDRISDQAHQTTVLATSTDVQVLVGTQPRARFAANSIDVSAPVAYTAGVVPAQPQHLVTKDYVDQRIVSEIATVVSSLFTI